MGCVRSMNTGQQALNSLYPLVFASYSQARHLQDLSSTRGLDHLAQFPHSLPL